MLHLFQISSILLQFIHNVAAAGDCSLHAAGHEDCTQSDKQIHGSSLLQRKAAKPNSNRERIERLFENSSEPPNVVDVMALLPPTPASMSQSVKDNHSRNFSVAVCSTGHLRTFILPGVYSSLAMNVLRTAPGAADFFLLGHLGGYAGSQNAQSSLSSFYDSQSKFLENPEDERIKAAEKFTGVRSEHLYISSGKCSDLMALRLTQGRSNFSCNENGNFMQIMWLDQCIYQVRNSGKKYDFIVRTRPDVGIFAPMPWNAMSHTRVNYMNKDAGGKADWFFVIPSQVIEKWWDAVVGLYLRSRQPGLPDYTIFNSWSSIRETDLPAVIVRSGDSAQCRRIVSNFTDQHLCIKRTREGFWNVLHEAVTVRD